MSNKRSKRHHFVPETFQKAFTENGKLWYSEKGQDNLWDDPDHRTPRGAFWEKDRNTVLIGDEPSDVMERLVYGPQDDTWGKLIPELLEIINANQIPDLGKENEKNLKILILETVKRSPCFANIPTDQDLGQQLYDELLSEKGEIPSEYIENYKLEAQSKAKRRQVGRDIRVRGVLEPSPKSEAALANYSFRWLGLTGKSSFILTSKMVHFIGNGGADGLINPKCELWMPISPKVCMILVRDEDGRIPPLLHKNDPKLVKDFNRFSARSSRMIASHSRTLLQSIISNKYS